ncbi:unnamed protein product [Caenorhabditis brenneri]
MNHRPFLLEMPDKVMSRIIGFGGFQDLFKLRKVCRDLRTFIDENCPNVNCTSLSLTFLPNKISLVANFLDREDEEITYRKQENGCRIQNKLFEKLDFVHAFFDDIHLILKYLPPCLPRFSLKFQYTNDESDYYIPEVQKNLNIVLESRNTKLPVRKFVMNAFKEEQVLTILPYLDPAFLEEIWILDSEFWLGVNKILETNGRCIPISTITCFEHTTVAFVAFFWITLEDMELIKETFFKSTTLQKLRFEYANFPDCQQYFNIFGPPVENQSEHCWILTEHGQTIRAIHNPVYKNITFEKIHQPNVSGDFVRQ